MNKLKRKFIEMKLSRIQDEIAMNERFLDEYINEKVNELLILEKKKQVLKKLLENENKRRIRY
jgi:hypothetical protein